MTGGPKIVHTYPVDDLVDHYLDGQDCVCGPTADHVRDAIRDPNLVGLVPVGPDAIPGPPSPPRPKNDRPYA